MTALLAQLPGNPPAKALSGSFEETFFILVRLILSPPILGTLLSGSSQLLRAQLWLASKVPVTRREWLHSTVLQLAALATGEGHKACH